MAERGERRVGRSAGAWRAVGGWCSSVVLGLLILVAGGAGTSAADVSTAAVMREMLSSTAQVVVVRENGGRRAGSSIVITAGNGSGKAVLITAAHVLTPVMPQEIRAVTPLRGNAVPARLIAIDEEADLAILETDQLDAKPISFAAESALGDQIWVTAFPWGGRATVVSGMVSQIDWDRSETESEYPFSGPPALIDATVSHGMSGGGVFDRGSGRLIGIVRSHRSVNVTLPGEPERTFSLPVAGETNVVSTRQILCFLLASGYESLISDAFHSLPVGSCRAGS